MHAIRRPVREGRQNFYQTAPPDRGASSFIFPPSPANLEYFAQALKAGCLVAIPTETVYGLAALALDETAAREIFRVKGRPLLDPLIVHVHEGAAAEKLAHFHPLARQLARAFWPGPLTLILPKRKCVPDLITAGRETVALRMPGHPVARDLLRRTGQPLAAPSANPFGYVSPTRAEHVSDSFGNRVPFVVDGGPSRIGIESTILDVSRNDKVELLRPGAISSADIEHISGARVHLPRIPETGADPLRAPGLLRQHYSPHSTLSLFAAGKPPSGIQDAPVVFLQKPSHPSNWKQAFWLSENGEPEIIAENLFSLLRGLDGDPRKTIFMELPKAADKGILMAVRDRMLRAAAKKQADSEEPAC